MIARTAVKRAASWIGLVALLLALVVAWQFLPVRNWILSLDAWIGRRGPLGVLVFALGYIGLVVLLAPADIMSIAAGLIFGLWGIPLVIVSATIGATFAFLVSRHLVRARVKEFAEKRDIFRAVDTLVRVEGWKLVALLRLNPLMPFNLQNYFFGATDIGVIPYVTATCFGIMPGAAGYVYLGTLGQAAATGNGAGGLKLVLLGAGLVATLVLVLFVGWRANVMLKNLGVDRNRA